MRAKLGPISVIEWTAYGGSAGDLMKADVAAIHGQLDVAVTSLVAAVQEAYADMKQSKDGAVLVTTAVSFSRPRWTQRV